MNKPTRIRAKKGRNAYRAEIRPAHRMAGAETHTPTAPFDKPKDQWWPSGKELRRDSKRSAAYRAEDRVRVWINESTDLEQIRFDDIADAARYARDLMETKWFQRRFPRFRSLVVRYVPGTRTCRGGPHYANWEGEVTQGGVSMSTWGLGKKADRRGEVSGGELILLHEIAHAITPAPRFGAWHDRRWARTFLELVKFKMGDKVYRKLRGEFDKERVKYGPTRGRR